MSLGQTSIITAMLEGGLGGQDESSEVGRGE